MLAMGDMHAEEMVTHKPTGMAHVKAFVRKGLLRGLKLV